MSTVYVREQGAVVRKRGERLVVTKEDRELTDIPLVHLDQLVVVGNVQLTTQAVAALLRSEVDVVFLSTYYTYKGRLLRTESKFAELRHTQLKVMSDEARSLEIARPVVVGKLTNQRVVLQRLAAELPAGPTREALQQAIAGIGLMREAARQVVWRGPSEVADIDRLRGFEGKAAAYYFGAIKALLDPAWGFNGRAYYPPPDPFNAALSLGYTLLLKDITAAVQLVGLDPYLGFFHTIQYARPSLALDAMEEFRPIIVDTLVLGLVGRKELTPADFVHTGKAERPVEMGERARELFVTQYEQRISSMVLHPPSGEMTSYRRCFELQVRQLARVVLGKADGYRAMTIR